MSGFSKNPHISRFTKIRPVKAELFHVDGQTNQIVASRIFQTRLKIVTKSEKVKVLRLWSLSTCL